MRKPNEAFGQAVREVLEERSLTFRGQGLRTGISHVTASKMAQGHVPDMETVLRWARGFGLDENEWLELAGYQRVGRLPVGEGFRQVMERVTAGLSDQALAELTGYTPAYIREIRSGGVPPIEVVQRLVARLRLDHPTIIEVLAEAGYGEWDSAGEFERGLKRLKQQYKNNEPSGFALDAAGLNSMGSFAGRPPSAVRRWLEKVEAALQAYQETGAWPEREPTLSVVGGDPEDVRSHPPMVLDPFAGAGHLTYEMDPDTLAVAARYRLLPPEAQEKVKQEIEKFRAEKRGIAE